MDNTMKITIPWKPGMAVTCPTASSTTSRSRESALSESRAASWSPPRTLPYTTKPKPESIQKEPFKLWKELGPNTNRKEH